MHILLEQKPKQTKQMKPNWYNIISNAISLGVSYGVRAAYKHTEDPGEEELEAMVFRSIMAELNEVIDFEADCDDDDDLEDESL